MSRNELERYRLTLKAKRDHVAASLRNRDEIAIEKTADAIDEVQLAGERELAIRYLDRESVLLRNVRSALARIADGTYGTCVRCEKEISPKRLNALPWAPFCIGCQEAVDRHEFESTETLEEFLAPAA